MVLLKQWNSDGLISLAVLEKLTHFLDLLVEWNQRINLTGLRTKEEMESILIAESILAARVFPLSNKKVLDFGSGAGIPGLIWAIYDPSIHLTSVEVREKKVAFQKEVVWRLGLEAEVLKGTFPHAVRGRKFDVIATRAVRFTSILWASARPLLAHGGSFVQFATRNVEEQGWIALPVSERTSLLTHTP